MSSISLEIKGYSICFKVVEVAAVVVETAMDVTVTGNVRTQIAEIPISLGEINATDVMNRNRKVHLEVEVIEGTIETATVEEIEEAAEVSEVVIEAVEVLAEVAEEVMVVVEVLVEAEDGE